ncbi:hypothetical protein [Marinoscillum sp.]|uniref:hypothetical protein n=1 Tax=Marinoscillum sp. TaxID=2024838 RepID=UPI003BABE5C4
MKRLPLSLLWIPIFLGGMACQQVTRNELSGLWELEHLEVDAVPRSANPTFIEINANNSFAVSRVSGDQVGMYHFDAPVIKFRSEDRSWFNTRWKIKYFREFIILRGLEDGYRGTQLRFKRIEVIPDFAEFEERVVGKWHLYKIRKNGDVEKVSASFQLDREGNYSMEDQNGLLERGRVVINTRHRKLIFEHDQTQWEIWFYGDELRLTNELMGLQYSLRRML